MMPIFTAMPSALASSSQRGHVSGSLHRSKRQRLESDLDDSRSNHVTQTQLTHLTGSRLTFENPVEARPREIEHVAVDPRAFAEASTLGVCDFIPFSVFGRRGAQNHTFLTAYRSIKIAIMCLLWHHMIGSASVSFTIGWLLPFWLRITYDLADARDRTAQFIHFDREAGGHIAQTWQQLIALAYPCLAGMQLVDQLMMICHRAFVNRASPPGPLLQFIEFCAGQANLTKRFLAESLRGACFDILFSAGHDMCTAQGLRLFLDAICSCELNSLLWWGTKCSSWVQICRATSLRDHSNGYVGDTNKTFVREGNLQAEITCLGFLVGILTGGYPCLEQPLSSVMPRLGSWESLIRCFGLVRTPTYMGAFNGDSMKPLQLWHLPGCGLESLARPRPDPYLFSVSLVEKGEGGAYTGKKDMLMMSEVYTTAFAAAVFDSFHPN